MALNNPPQKLQPESRPEEPDPLEAEAEEEELENLETEVNHMAEKILEYRATLPDQLRTTFASLLSAQRPVLPEFDFGSDPGPSGDTNPGLTVASGEQVKLAVLTEDDQKTAEKVRRLKDKISSNISTMPIVLQRMKECMSKMDKLDSCNGTIHPAFRKKKTS